MCTHCFSSPNGLFFFEDGLCNGTRMIVRGLRDFVLDCEIVTSGRRVIIPRITLTPSDSGLPCRFKRRQFPVRVCWAMTVNKAQGQTLNKVILYLLGRQLFSHGQLYVALSRGKYFGSVKCLSPTRAVRNVVWEELLLAEGECRCPHCR